jgi:hypothetical protein
MFVKFMAADCKRVTLAFPKQAFALLTHKERP